MTEFALQFIPEEGGEPNKQRPGLLNQALSGGYEGVAALMGLPVDISQGVGRLAVRGIDALAGTNFADDKADMQARLGPPIGSSEALTGMFDDLGVLSPEPETSGERVARGVGRELGSALVPGSLAARTAGVAPVALTELSAALGGQVAGEIAPDPLKPAAEFLGNLAGGIIPNIPAKPRGLSLEDVNKRSQAAYSRVADSDMRLTQQGRDDLLRRLDDRFVSGPRATRVSERNTPKAFDAIEDARTFPAQPHIYSDVEDYRRAVGRDVAGATDPSERARGVAIKQEIDDYLASLDPSQATGSNVQGTIADLREGREFARRGANVDLLMDQLDQAGRRAARSGRGGNTVNTVRQNIDKILNNRKLRAGFSEEDIAAMEKIVHGSRTENAARLAASMAPSTGALPLMANLTAAGAAGLTDNPWWLAPMVVGQASQMAADGMSSAKTRALIQQVLNGGEAPVRKLSEKNRAAIASMLASEAVRANTQ